MARKSIFQNLEEKIIKNKIKEALLDLKKGKEDELLSKLDDADFDKIDEYTKKYDKEKLMEIGVNINELKREIPTETIEKFKKKIKNYPPELEDRIIQLLDI